MNNFDLAIQAKRGKNFDLALDYYEKELREEGLSVNLLQAIAKIYYLQKQNNLAVGFHLAATHLALHMDHEQYKQGDPTLLAALQQVPKHIADQFPHPIGPVLLYDSNSPRHVAHALLDREETFQKAPEFRQYAEIYYSHILGDGSHEETLRKYDLTIEDQLDFDEDRYNSVGYRFLIDMIKWSEIENPNVFELYLS
mgnify:CR=1 FL=1